MTLHRLLQRLVQVVAQELVLALALLYRPSVRSNPVRVIAVAQLLHSAKLLNFSVNLKLS
jgi:hypothetical protein